MKAYMRSFKENTRDCIIVDLFLFSVSLIKFYMKFPKLKTTQRVCIYNISFPL